ncbi:iron ABC transporter permease [Hahella ganghwensis]|uniref:iron ABC transporter permease n=1 Tax=Hahella ganghwensis TaxID=286420 RepID=UPI00037FF6DD|nr:iron ABC transporter permease [Hahella ganghwensis]
MKLTNAVFAGLTLLGLLIAASFCLNDQCTTVFPLLLTNNAYSLDQELFVTLTIPRTLLACLIGAAMALAGNLIQQSLQNPFASPTTLGINAGAMVGLIAGQLIFASLTPWEASLWAFGGAAMTALVVYGFAAWLGSSALNTILVGMALSLALGALTSGFMLFYENRLDGMFLWGAGTLQHLETPDLISYSLPLGICIFLGIFTARALDLFHLGDQTASSLGVSVAKIRGLSLLLATILAGLCISIVGVISFVGLVAPHLARLFGVRKAVHHAVLTAIFGAVMLLAADFLARVVGGHDFPLPAGAMTTIIGGPFLLWMLLRLSKQRTRLPEAREVGLSPLFACRPGTLLTVLIITLAGLLWLTSPNSSLDSPIAYLYAYRSAVAALAGAALACSGLIFQGLLRNPLASPDISGVTTVGVLVVVITLSFSPDLSRMDFAWLSMFGSLLVLPVFFLLLRRPAYSPTHVALVGMTLSAIAATLNTLLLTLGASQASDALLWLSGTTYGVTQSQWWLLVALTVPLIGWVLHQARLLDILQLGPELSQALNVTVKRQGLLMLAAACVLAAASVAVVGGIGFVGLMAPHLASMLGLSNYRQKMAGSLLIGAILLIAADALAQSVMSPFELAAGITTAVLGGTYFVILLLTGKYRQRFSSNPSLPN